MSGNKGIPTQGGGTWISAPLSNPSEFVSSVDGESFNQLLFNPTIIPSLESGIANVLDFGADPTGVADSTGAINAAAASVAVNGFHKSVYLPTGTYLVTDALPLVVMGQEVFGDGIDNTTILVSSAFNLSASGVFSMNANAGSTLPTIYNAGPRIRDLTITFQQVDTATKASLIQFPPAIYITNTLRWRVTRVKMAAGWDGIYAYANTTLGLFTTSVGGGYCEDCEFGCLNVNFYLDGATDTMRIVNPHFFPFGLTANQQTIFENPALTTGVATYRADQLTIDNGLFFVGQGIVVAQSANGETICQMSNCQFDTFSGINISAGSVTAASMEFIPAVAGCQAITMTGGALFVTSASFFPQSLAPGSAVIAVEPPNSGVATLIMSSFLINSGALDIHHITVNTQGQVATSVLMLTNGGFTRAGNNSYAHETVLIGNAFPVATITGCQMSDKGTGTGTFISVASDLGHRIIGNQPFGWANVFPASPVNGIYQWNSGNSIAGLLLTPNGSGNSLTSTGISSFTGITGFSGDVGFYGNAPGARPTATGAKGGNAALASLLTCLSNLGLITDATS